MLRGDVARLRRALETIERRVAKRNWASAEAELESMGPQRAEADPHGVGIAASTVDRRPPVHSMTSVTMSLRIRNRSCRLRHQALPRRQCEPFRLRAPGAYGA
jgi:hypothetical protein